MSCSRGCCATQAEHYRAVVVRPLPSSRAVQERAETADMAAYKRLRADGVQPKAISGSASLERDAGTKIEIETGHVIRNARLRREFEQASKNPPPSPAA